MTSLNLTNLEKNLKVSFKNKCLLTQALTHRSYLNEHPQAGRSNERLEFLGDALLEAWVSTKLFHLFPDFPEGLLTSLRTAIVRTETLAKIAQKLKLGQFLLLSKGEEAEGGRKNINLLADCFEAVIGAVFCDQGQRGVNRFLNHILLPEIKKISPDELKDPKSLFQEIAQEKYKITPTYQILKSEGPDHDKTFWAGVFLEKKKVGQGQGKSKQEAETQAAQDALEKLGAKIVEYWKF